MIISSFQVKTSWERLRKSEKKKKLSFRSVPTRPVTKNSKKIAKKMKKIKKHYYGFISNQNKLGKPEKE